MNDQPDLKFRHTLVAIRQYFDFLFKRGFRIVSVLFTDQRNENWQVSLMSENYVINIYGEQEIINLALGVMQPNNECKLFDLEYLAQMMNNGRGFFHLPDEFPINEAQQFKRIARFLEKHLISILAQVGKETLPRLERPLDNSAAQQKRTII